MIRHHTIRDARLFSMNIFFSLAQRVICVGYLLESQIPHVAKPMPRRKHKHKRKRKHKNPILCEREKKKYVLAVQFGRREERMYGWLVIGKEKKS
jgi:hypothetical protein